ncbi:DUF6538 domain-containing protein [Methylobacterium sp. Leaf399]|uniref:DUF6538 domain-containing protein n=1 Tax=Methylobacterium sp. Leaf399 TaxID=1736364 RepID=UPI000B2AF0FD|nr:DUF6538 domain-containing protein [Methylobacterium sp. Leaf399]
MTTRPWKHPKTASYYLRRAVPLELRALVGKREEKVSLGTKDPIEAKRLHAVALMELEQRWAALRVGPRRLSEREAHELLPSSTSAGSATIERSRAGRPSGASNWATSCGRADAIIGHSHRSIGDQYGEYDVSAMKRELEKIPAVAESFSHA